MEYEIQAIVGFPAPDISNRKQFVAINGLDSETQSLQCVVSQGSIYI